MGSYFDERLLFGEEVDISGFTAAGGDEIIGDYIDLGVAAPGYLERGTEIPVMIQVIAQVTSAGSPTVEFKIQSDDNSSFSSPSDCWSSGLIAEATLVAGYQIPRAVLANLNQRYIRLTADVSVDLTGGTITAWVEAGRGAN